MRHVQSRNLIVMVELLLS